MRLRDHGLGNHRTVLQHILEVHQITVVLLLGKIVRIMKMNDSLIMRIHNILRKKDTAGKVLGNLSCHIVPLRRIDRGILVGVLLVHLLVDLIDQSEDSVVRGIGLPGELPLITVTDILLRDLISAHLHDALLNHILDVLDAGRVRHVADLARDLIGNRDDLILIQLMNPVNLFVRLADRVRDLLDFKRNLLSVPFYDICFHFHTH